MIVKTDLYLAQENGHPTYKQLRASRSIDYSQEDPIKLPPIKSRAKDNNFVSKLIVPNPLVFTISLIGQSKRQRVSICYRSNRHIPVC